jgi:hypothetical protein
MLSDDAIRAATTAEGLKIKRNNLWAALLSGAFLVWIASRISPQSVAGTGIGFVAGFFYANAFEYCLHRFILHAGRGFFGKQHMVHHETLNAPEMARYVNFSSNPLGVVALFAVNAAPFLLLQWIFRATWTAGMFSAFALYYIAFEEIHWRTHMGGRLPKWLRFAARHHMMHHAHDTGRYNVFLPICDRLVESFQPHTRTSRNAG